MVESDDSKKSENIFEIMDGMLFQLNKTKRLFVIMILTILIIPPVALLAMTTIFDNPFVPNQEMLELRAKSRELHADLQQLTKTLEGLSPEERVQKLDEFLSSEKYKMVSEKIEKLSVEEMLQKPPDDISHEFKPIIRGPQFIIVIISLAWLGIGIRQWFVLSKFSKKYQSFKKKQLDVDKKLEDDEGSSS
jgi:hypothetical protein